MITDSPCHGSEFHNLNQNENGQSDMFADGDPEGRDKNMIEKKNNSISIILQDIYFPC